MSNFVKFHPVRSKLFHTDGRTDRESDRHNELDVFLTVHHELTIY